MKSLVLAEKPSVGKEIARVLGCRESHRSYMEGKDYVVTWALGHLVALAEPEDYDPKYRTWNLDDLPIIPQKMKLKVIKETAAQFQAISRLAKRDDLKELIIATDAGREGELVARWIMEMIRWRKPFKRLWISSQTDQAIKRGFKELKPGRQYDALYDSAVCRAEADWLIGLNVTRALTSKHQEGLSAGRVQTPTLAMIVDREKEIRQFKPVPYWTIEADFGSFKGRWTSADGQRIMDEAVAKRIAEKIQSTRGIVRQKRSRVASEPHPLAYDLTELQREANRRFGFSAKKTLGLLQRLYENHKAVTYPRTDSRYLTSDMASTLKERLASVSVGPYAEWTRPLLNKQRLPLTKRIIDDRKVTDHHALIPTEQPVSLSKLTSDERKIYDLIVRRFIALFYPPCQYESIKVEIDIASEKFLATGKAVKDWGWKRVYQHSPAEDAAEETVSALPSLKEGQSVRLRDVQLRQRYTEPPERYDEAELLSQMEKKMLGTPATRAEIIERLIQTEAVERQGKYLIPTPKARQLIDLVADELRSPELTARWEEILERIARGKEEPDRFLRDIREQTKRLVQQIALDDATYRPHNVTGSKCPTCGEFLRERKTKRGKMLVCPNRECDYRRLNERIYLKKRCPQCRKKMELREGKAGKFAHCRPCNVIEMLEDQAVGKINKRKERELLNRYRQKESLTSNLGEALKAALKDQKQ